MFHKLQKGAIFIADAHYPNHGREFLSFLQDIKDGKIKTPQLILMGDIFDLLVGNSSYLKQKFKNEIELIDSIAKDIEVIYIEGNHDFNLKPLFKNVLTVPIKNQPFIMQSGKQQIALSHGDKYCMGTLYYIYTKIIRNPFILKLIPETYAKNKLQKMKNKKICKEIKDFKHLVRKIVKNYKSNLIIEGHYHQGVIIDNYVSLPSFACSKKIGVFSGKNLEFLKG